MPAIIGTLVGTKAEVLIAQGMGYWVSGCTQDPTTDLMCQKFVISDFENVCFDSYMVLIYAWYSLSLSAE
jgi:hypothetical protein